MCARVRKRNMQWFITFLRMNVSSRDFVTGHFEGSVHPTATRKP